MGRPLVARLLEAGHDVVGTTRRKDRAANLRAQGVESVIVDALDAAALAAAARRSRPDVVVQQLTALPQSGAAGASDPPEGPLHAGRGDREEEARGVSVRLHTNEDWGMTELSSLFPTASNA